MAHRFILYDALHSLHNGHVLVVASDHSFLQFLEGCPEVHIVSEMLIENGWVYPIDESESRFKITPRGEEIYQRGHEQYQQFSWIKKTLARPFLLKW